MKVFLIFFLMIGFANSSMKRRLKTAAGFAQERYGAYVPDDEPTSIEISVEDEDLEKEPMALALMDASVLPPEAEEEEDASNGTTTTTTTPSPSSSTKDAKCGECKVLASELDLKISEMDQALRGIVFKACQMDGGTIEACLQVSSESVGFALSVARTSLSQISICNLLTSLCRTENRCQTCVQALSLIDDTMSKSNNAVTVSIESIFVRDPFAEKMKNAWSLAVKTVNGLFGPNARQLWCNQQEC